MSNGAIQMLLAAAAVCLMAPAGAQVSSDQPGSMLIFPKVIVDGTRDTVIQISNVANSQVEARCWYVNGALTFPDQPPGPLNEPAWTLVEFAIHLTDQQPTAWVASLGRPPDPGDEPCSHEAADYDCYGAGLDPGRVPPIPELFTGELRCVETDLSGAPLSGNHLTGAATLENRLTGDVAKYSAISLSGLAANDGNNELILGEEYAGCPQAQIVNHAADGAEVLAVGPGSDTTTELTLVPCSANYDTNDPETATVLFEITNEFEQRLSAFATVQCWLNLQLREINMTFDVIGTRSAQTRLRPSAQSSTGIVAVAEERRAVGGTSAATAAAAANLHVEGVRAAVDVVTLR